MLKNALVLVALLASAVQAETAALTWTATGDDGAVGTATAYDLRMSTSVITAANFNAATQVLNVPAPKISGTTETFTVTGLTAGTYYFAIKAVDEVGNWSAISNVLLKIILDTTPPAAMVDLR